MSAGTAVLVIAGFGVWVDGAPRTGKIETHVYPVAAAADEVAFVCTGPTAGREETITYHQVAPSRWKPLTLLRQFLVALRLALTREFDLVASFSLVPYGLFALVAGALSRTPTHLGIIGIDLDVHAAAWYGPAVVWLFRRFDAVSVAGGDFSDRLVDLGVPPGRVFTVLHPVGERFGEASRAADPAYDVLWLTRMSAEKDPLLFVETMAELRARGVDYTAAMVGTGPLDEQVREAVTAADLDGRVYLPGWAETPLDYYREAGVYVLTSEREMLPLTLVEAMLVGVPPVAPDLGAIPELVTDGHDGRLLGERTPEAYADALEPLLTDRQARERMAANATEVADAVSFDAVAAAWTEILAAVGGTERSPDPAGQSAPES